MHHPKTYDNVRFGVPCGVPDSDRLVTIDETGETPNRDFLVMSEDIYDPDMEDVDFPFEEILQIDEAELEPAPPTSTPGSPPGEKA